jgi:hypothetical protein
LLSENVSLSVPRHGLQMLPHLLSHPFYGPISPTPYSQAGATSPPLALPSLVDNPLGVRLCALEEHISAASLLVYVLLAGAFNARMGVHPASHILHPQFPQMIPAPRGCTEYQVTLTADAS